MVTPGEVTPAKADDIELCAGRRRQVVKVKNTGDRGIQVGSHFHFFEVNRALEFERAKTIGMRLDIPAGTAIRFEPGAEMEVTLVDFGGSRVVVGFNGLMNGAADSPRTRRAAVEEALRRGFKGTSAQDLR